MMMNERRIYLQTMLLVQYLKFKINQLFSSQCSYNIWSRSYMHQMYVFIWNIFFNLIIIKKKVLVWVGMKGEACKLMHQNSLFFLPVDLGLFVTSVNSVDVVADLFSEWANLSLSMSQHMLGKYFVLYSMLSIQS